jgi:membrane protein DedA with SNARE-associated domain
MPVWDACLALLAEHGYTLVFVLVLLDAAGLPLPGELLLLGFGVLARETDLDLTTGVAVAAAGAVAGDTLGYALGRAGGDRLLGLYCRAIGRSRGCVEHAGAVYARFGRLAIVLGRFVVGLRALATPLAGSTRFPFGRFLLLDVAGAVAWSATFIGAGAVLGVHAGAVGHWLVGGLGLAVLATLGVVMLRRQTPGAAARAPVLAGARPAAPRARPMVSKSPGGRE